MSTKPAQPDGALPAQYKPAEHEPRIRQVWESSGAFHADPSRVLSGERRPFCVLIPPPNVTAALHLGHAFNNTLQDVLVRAHRMMGFETLWMPGTDHAGIATQAVVERRLREEGTLRGPLRDAMTRDGFVAKAQAWKNEYEAKILGQLKAMGCSCDWDRTRFTMDDVCARAVREAFFQLFKAGLIYRGKRLVNWDPVLQTAVADDELEDREVEGKFYYLRYPLVTQTQATTGRRDGATGAGGGDAGLPAARRADWRPVTWSELAARGYPGAGAYPEDQPAWLTVATTRPETYLGDTGVAVNPKDTRAVALRGLMVELPIVGRIIPIIEDDYVVMPAGASALRAGSPTSSAAPDPTDDASRLSAGADDAAREDPKARYATGFLKVTPGHDENDYALYQRHKGVMDAAQGGEGRALINIMAPDASISDRHGWNNAEETRAAHIFLGLSREKARDLVVREFQSREIGTETLLEAIKPYTHTVPFSDRSKVPIEPWLSDQWYVKVTDDLLRGQAQRALSPSQRSTATFPARPGEPGDATLHFFPERYAKTYEAWHDNLRDWCVSRQLWWGHRIPVWSRAGGKRSQSDLHDPLAGSAPADSSSEGSPDRVVFQERLDAATGQAVTLACIAPGNEHAEARLESEGFTQDSDVLDTWFSSAAWPISTLGWPDPDRSDQTRGMLAAFNPSTVLCTGRDIITLWVSRMVMFNRFLREGTAPFRDVYIHSIIQDGHGQRMSKSLGNGVDPLDIIHSHGADAMRFVLTQIATSTQDVRLPVDLVCPHTGRTFEPKFITSPQGYLVAAPIQDSPGDPSKKMVSPFGAASGAARPTADMPVARNTSAKFDLGRNFCNKLWNASRYALGILGAPALRAGSPSRSAGPQTPVTTADLSLIDRWMLSRIQTSVESITQSLKSYQFASYAQSMYDLMWRDFCDWYLEAIKPTVAESRAQQAVLAHSLESIVRLLHPLVPFVTEVIWERLRSVQTLPIQGVTLAPSRVADLLCTAGWPEVAPWLRDEAAEAALARMQSLAGAIREVRAKHQVPPKRRIVLHASPALARDISQAGGIIEALCTLSRVDTDPTAAGVPGPSVAFTFEAAEYRLSELADAVDAGAEKERLTKQVADLRKSIAALDGRLSNPGYVDRAPPALVQQTRDEKSRKEADLASAVAALERLA